MTGALIGLTVTYGALACLLLSLHLRSDWCWPVKAGSICAALPAFIATFMGLQAMIGWPSDAALPAQFQLHAALVEEPAGSDGKKGAIFLWLTPWETLQEKEATPGHDVTVDIAVDSSLRPRAFNLPYSRDLHNRIDAMRERLQKGHLVTGRHLDGSSWKRRFGRQSGIIDLYAPPAPPMPTKEG